MSTLAAAVLKHSDDAMPVLAVMGISTLLAVAATEYVRQVDRREGALVSRGGDR